MKRKQDSAPMHLLLGALFLLTIGQLLGLVYRAPQQEPETSKPSEAVQVVTGTVIRQEIPISGSREGLVPLKEDGTLVSAGELLFQEDVRGADSRWVTARAGEYAEMSLPRRREKVAELLEATDSGLSGREAEELTALLLGENETSEWNPGQEPETVIKAPAAGLFSSHTDGLELMLTPGEPWPVISLPMDSGEETVGKIVLTDVWYFAAELPFCPEESVTVQVLTEEPFFVKFTPERTEPAGDRWRVLFRCQEGCGAVINYRNLSVIFSSERQFRGGNFPGNLI
ncbi:MAG: hypothetical protein PUC06_09750 [Oscillospiraceae bacterium]|nr:hypothetical protein [Oscillospiraceae bacterium]